MQFLFCIATVGAEPQVAGGERVANAGLGTADAEWLAKMHKQCSRMIRFSSACRPSFSLSRPNG
ncbi:hypothetical protein AJ88_07245 [Mesorhizobium amorphae CCBAU 01583]|nr:hypothetical protein AJ88_07245 [Mesorhizobium amorphae CCBAU 01583]